MPFLAGLAVLFVGVTGGADSGYISDQVEAVLAAKHVEASHLPAASLRALVHHTARSRDIVRQLHADGVIAGELVSRGGHITLELVIYTPGGALKTASNVTLTGRQLSADELDILRTNFEDDVAALIRAAPHGSAAGPARRGASPAVATTAAAPATSRTSRAARPAPAAASDVGSDDDLPPVPGAPAPARPKPAAAPAAAAPTRTAQADDDDAAVRPDTSGGAVAGVTASTTRAHAHHVQLSVGLGALSRSFRPSANTVQSYTGSPVGAIQLGVAVQPTSRLTLDLTGERTLQMFTPIGAGRAATAISRGEAIASFSIVHGALDLAPEVGIGRRTFVVDSTSTMRSPDGDYNYAILGAVVRAALGAHVRLQGKVAYEPVMSGTEPTGMAFGGAVRTAIDAGVALEVRPSAHVVIRAAADYQRFAWSWSMTAAHIGGDAVDAYPTAMLSAGAEY